jgi:hypothetical protein
MPMVHRRGDQQKRRLENQPPANAKQNFLQKRFEVSRNNTGWLAELVRIICPICLYRETESRHKGSGLRAALVLPTSHQRTFGPLDLWAKGRRQKTLGPKATRSMPSVPLERPRRSSGTAEFVLSANQTKLEPLRIPISTFSTAAANPFELANGCSVQKTRPRYGPGTGSAFTCSSSMMILSGVIDQ